MKTIPQFALLTIAACFLAACSNSDSRSAEATNAMETPSAPMEQGLAGTYVSDMYDKRDEGYDWVGIRVDRLSDYELDISVRSRADKKRPTCTYDAVAERIEEHIYQTVFEGDAILFTFSDDALTVSPKDTANRDLLYYFCSGGGSLAGTYSKIDGAWDESQVDPTIYTGKAELKDFTFFVESKPQGEKINVTVRKIDGQDRQNYEEQEVPVDANITGILAEDINGSGLPELLIYLYDEQQDAGNIVAYSVNADRKLETFDFPEIDNAFEAYPDTIYTANGNEPGWGIVLMKEGSEYLNYNFVWDWGNTRFEGKAFPVSLDEAEGSRAFALVNPMNALLLTVKKEQCFDDADREFTTSVTLKVGDRTYYACGDYREK